MISLDTTASDGAKIKVIGVGGGGGNAVNNMINRGINGVDFIASNTDKQALDHNLAPLKIQVGKELTLGLGAGADPEVGRKAVEENRDQIKEALAGSNMIFITSGMGGGTGTGGAPVVAQIARESGALVVAIVTLPFSWEGKERMESAKYGIEELRNFVDALIVIPNEKLLDIGDISTSFSDSFKTVDEILYNATLGISDIISCHGIINVDFADVRAVMSSRGDALMGIGTATGENRAVEATQKALNSPLLEGVSIEGAKGILVNITAGSNLTIHEVKDSVSMIEKASGGKSKLIQGIVQNPEPSEEFMITVVATGFNINAYEKDNLTSKPKKSNQELPFNKGSFDSPALRPSLIYGNRRKPLEDAVAQPETAEFVSSPKGVSQLSKYDSPAYERRGKNDVILGGQGAARIEKLKESSKQNNTVIDKKHLEVPAFRRRIIE